MVGRVFVFILKCLHLAVPVVLSVFGEHVSASDKVVMMDQGSLHRSSPPNYVIHINVSKEISPLEHFWKSTGFCPPLPHQDAAKFDLSPDMTQNLAFIGAIPHSGIKQVRIHWLLNLITIYRVENGKPIYNYSLLDTLIQTLWQNGLKPGFEIMGNPSDFFTDFENKTQVYLWRDLIQEMAEHFIAEYGVGYVSTWNFETWNEPDHKDFDQLNMTLQGFLNYFDACSEGLKAASPLLRLGGAGGGYKVPWTRRSPICWALLRHCQNGTNYFTKEKGVRLDFIAFHKKGLSPDNSATLLAKERAALQVISKHFPALAHIPIYNDEGDILVGWSRPQWWRADTTYAAAVAKVLGQHQNMVVANSSFKFRYQLLSNDNGFLSYNPNFFTQRTLLARFQINNTHPPHVQFIRKPVYTLMGLLALLGDTQVESILYTADKKPVSPTDNIGVLASVHAPPRTESSPDSWQTSVLVYNSMDTHNGTGLAKVRVYVNMMDTNKNRKSLRWVLYHIDNYIGNPYSNWLLEGQPHTPSWEQLQQMRLHENPGRIIFNNPLTTSGSDPFVDATFPLPGVLLLHICAKSKQPPDQVNGLRVSNITGGQVLIIWSDKCINTKCINTYEVEFAAASEWKPEYKRINGMDSIFTIFVFSPDPSQQRTGDPDSVVRGTYRVRAVDYWDRVGEYSLPVQYG